MTDNALMAIVDRIPAPAGDAVTFRLYPVRLWLGTALVFAPVWPLAHGLLAAVTAVSGGSPHAGDPTEWAITVVVVAMAGGFGAVLGAGNNLAWVRASSAGLEFAATRCQPALLPWSEVRSVRLRLVGPLTELVVTPTSVDAANAAPVSARPPRLRWRAGAPEFRVDVGMLTPGPAALLAELRRRLAEHG